MTSGTRVHAVRRIAAYGLDALGHLRLAVAGASGPRPALVRNALKIFVPWNLGHLVAYGAMAGGFVRGTSWS